jgi:hypothetical protein
VGRDKPKLRRADTKLRSNVVINLRRGLEEADGINGKFPLDIIVDSSVLQLLFDSDRGRVRQGDQSRAETSRSVSFTSSTMIRGEAFCWRSGNRERVAARAAGAAAKERSVSRNVRLWMGSLTNPPYRA